MDKGALILTEEFLMRSGCEPARVAEIWESYDGKPEEFEDWLKTKKLLAIQTN